LSLRDDKNERRQDLIKIGGVTIQTNHPSTPSNSNHQVESSSKNLDDRNSILINHNAKHKMKEIKSVYKLSLRPSST
jgi:hypothetical protein